MHFYSEIPHFLFVKEMLYPTHFLTDSSETQYAYVTSRGIFSKMIIIQYANFKYFYFI